MAEPIVSFLVESIGRLLMEEGKFLVGVRDEAEQLHSELKMMRALLRDADERQHEAAGALVREWVLQSKEVAYEAENILEDYAFKLATRSNKKGVIAAVKRCARILNECYIRHKVGLEIRSLNSRISNLRGLFQGYGIRALTEKVEYGSGHSTSQQQLRMTYSINVVEDEDFVGFRHDVEILVEKLVKEDDVSGQQYGVVSISGMGGSGKTTLARKVYNHPSVKRHFDALAWVCISQKWQARQILEGILFSFLPARRQEIKMWRDEEIVTELLRFQQNRNCLVVLDDIWSIDAWECIKFAFPVRKKVNKILITTRNKNVAMHIGRRLHGYHHEPRLLSVEEGWELLQKKALKHEPTTGYGDIHRLEALGKEMVKICGGLPLALVVLGGVLATKEGFHEWNLVYRNIKRYLGKGESIQQEEEGEIQKILAMSYNDLPYKLKPCFLYMSCFPEDEEIDTERLYHLWIAEGLVFAEDRIREEETIIDVAERYLEELVKRCILQAKKNFRLGRGYRLCKIHDLMRDLCLAKAREEKFLEVVDCEHENGAPSSTGNASSIHRIVIYLRENDASRYVFPEMEATRHLIRALVFRARSSGNCIPQLTASNFNKFKMLRSLSIEGVITPGIERISESSSIPDDVFKLQIGKLIHLRFLSLRESKLVISPASISSLEHLETLDLTRAKIGLTEPYVPFKFRRLRHLILMGFEIIGSYKLQIIVSNTIEIINALDYDAVVVQNLLELSHLRKIYIRLSDNVIGVEEMLKLISNSNQLREAIILGFDLFQRYSPETELELVGQLFRSNLEYLYLHSRLRRLPEYQPHMFRNLSELILSASWLEEDPMELLEKLPCLQTLVFWLDAYLGKEMVCHSGGFTELRYLVLHHCHNLEKWTLEVGAMPNLAYLQMSSCESLKYVPEVLLTISTLKEIVLEDMSEEFRSDYALKFPPRKNLLV